MWVYVHRLMHVCACGDQMSTSGIVLPETLILFFEIESLIGQELISWLAGQWLLEMELSPRFPEPGLQIGAMKLRMFTWVLEIELGSLCFLGKDCLPIPELFIPKEKKRPLCFPDLELKCPSQKENTTILCTHTHPHTYIGTHILILYMTS